MNETSFNESSGNDTGSSFPLDPNDFLYDINILLIGLYVAVFVLSVTANTLVVIIVIKYHYMRNVTNLFLVNLSIADLLVSFVSMIMAVKNGMTIMWTYGHFMCKIAYYLQGVAVAASVFTITAMSVDRYLAISQSMIMQKLTRRSAFVTILFLWIIALCTFSPIPWVMVLKEYRIPEENPIVIFEICHEEWTLAPITRGFFGTLTFVMLFAIPGTIIFLTYSLMGRKLCSVQPPFDDEGSASTQQSVRLMKERKKVALILLLLAILFAVCWLPYNIIQLLLDNELINESSFKTIQLYTLLLGHANSAINPMVYCFMTKNFRKSVKKLVCGAPDNLSNRHHQRCKIRWPARTPMSSSGYDSYHSPHKKCYLQMHNLKANNGGTQMTTSGTRVSRRLRSGSIIAKHLQPGVLDKTFNNLQLNNQPVNETAGEQKYI